MLARTGINKLNKKIPIYLKHKHTLNILKTRQETTNLKMAKDLKQTPQ